MTERQGGTASPSPMTQGYPTSTSAPTVTPTPTPDAQGYLPPPTNITTTMVTLGSSPYADLLVPLQAALDAQDLSWLRNTAAWANNMSFMPIGCSDAGDGCGTKVEIPTELATTEANALAGTNALIQGYVVEPRSDGEGYTWICLQVLMYPFGTTLAYPTAAPGPPGPAEGNPSTVTIDASDIVICQQAGQWSWDAWYFGGYHEIVEMFAWNGATDYVVVRP